MLLVLRTRSIAPRRSWFSVVLALALAGCGSKPPPQQPVIGHEVPKTPPATCSDVGVILRGPVSVSGSDDPGRAREAVIANACEIDHWSAQVIDCIASEKKPDSCLTKLSEKQNASYMDKLSVWSEQYGGNEYGGDMGNDGMDAPPDIACVDAVGAADLYTPVPKLDASDELWDRSLRKHALETLCEDDAWDEAIRTCLGPTPDIDNSACLQSLPVDARNHVTAKLGEIDAQVAKVIDARKKKPDCKKVVAVHYADAQWKGKADFLKGKDRTKAIAESRTLMSKACTSEKWDDTTRACMVATDGDTCFVSSGSQYDRWGYPANGVVVATGIPECDAWGAEVQKLAACDKFPQSAKDAIEQSYQQVTQGFAKASKEDRAAAATTCKQIIDAVKQARVSVGCP